MIDPIIHTLMVAQTYHMEALYATTHDCIDVAARSLFEDISLQQDAALHGREYLDDCGCFTDALAKRYTDLSKRS